MHATLPYRTRPFRSVLARAAALAALLLAAAAPGAAAQQQGLVHLSALLRSITGDAAAERASADRRLAIPVLGIRPEQLRDTYNASRSGGRRHDAIDIHAPRGTPVLAASDGEIIKLHSGARGGISLYQLDADGVTRYYYAHLDRYADGVREGVRVRRGQVIGYVGDTGNAQPGDYHLHFSIARLSDRRRWWTGVNLNPFDLLRGMVDTRTARSTR
jgi:peptidoglycan LD-endopeptidase LytH